jgi:hypothetical protein
MLNKFVSNFMINWCSAWCFVDRFDMQGKMHMYLWVSHTISMANSCGGGVRSWLGVVGYLVQICFKNHYLLYVVKIAI